jgi:hypothetical protein
MSAREALILLAHAQICERCRERLLGEPSAVFRGRALTDEEKARLSELDSSDFVTAELLAEASGYDLRDLNEYHDHPVARLRHF